MALSSTVLSFVLSTVLGAWLGMMTFFSFVGAPRAFAVYDDRGGEYVTDMFPRYYRIGVGLGAIAVAAGLSWGTLETVTPAFLVALASIGVATLTAAYSLIILLPKMNAAEGDAFDQYHRQSVALNGVMMLLVTVALIGVHLTL